MWPSAHGRHAFVETYRLFTPILLLYDDGAMVARKSLHEAEAHTQIRSQVIRKITMQYSPPHNHLRKATQATDKDDKRTRNRHMTTATQSNGQRRYMLQAAICGRQQRTPTTDHKEDDVEKRSLEISLFETTFLGGAHKLDPPNVAVSRKARSSIPVGDISNNQ